MILLTDIKDAVTTMDANLLSSPGTGRSGGMTGIASLMQGFITASQPAGARSKEQRRVRKTIRTAQWATEGSLKVLRMVVDPSTYAYDAQYDVIKDGVWTEKIRWNCCEWRRACPRSRHTRKAASHPGGPWWVKKVRRSGTSRIQGGSIVLADQSRVEFGQQ